MRCISPIQLGGGIRDLDTIVTWLDKGVDRVILGTAAVRDPALVREAARDFPGCIAVGIDARDGKVAIEGWAETSEMTALDLARRFEDAGVAAIIHTDIARDGVLEGLNLEATAAIARAVTIPVIASGGLAGIDDVQRLLEPRYKPCWKARSSAVRSTTGGSIRAPRSPCSRIAAKRRRRAKAERTCAPAPSSSSCSFSSCWSRSGRRSSPWSARRSRNGSAARSISTGSSLASSTARTTGRPSTTSASPSGIPTCRSRSASCCSFFGLIAGTIVFFGWLSDRQRKAR